MVEKKRVIIRYSEAFKHQVITEVESGELTCYQARIKYGIKGMRTVQYWIKRKGKLELLPKIIRVEKPDEINRIKELEKQIRQLKEALADSHIREVISDTRFEIICRQQGLNPEEIKKKLQDKPLSKP